jgi:hypothetical protein
MDVHSLRPYVRPNVCTSVKMSVHPYVRTPHLPMLPYAGMGYAGYGRNEFPYVWKSASGCIEVFQNKKVFKKVVLKSCFKKVCFQKSFSNCMDLGIYMVQLMGNSAVPSEKFWGGPL